MERINLSLSSILESIMINEDSNLKDFRDNKDKINYAIDNNLMISLNYDDGKPIKGKKGRRVYGNPKGFRRMIPYCLGSRKGRLALRCFHSWKTNTKKGPFKWKFMYLDRMSNVRVYKSMHIPEIPELANPEGDAHMDEIINMIGMKQRTQTPIEREREITNKIADTQPTKSGAIQNKDAGIDIKPTNKGGLNSLQNLRPAQSNKKLSYNFQNTRKNIEDFEKQNTELSRQQRWSDYDKAEREREEQMKRNDVPNPPTSNPGPVNKYNIEGYDEDVLKNEK